MLSFQYGINTLQGRKLNKNNTFSLVSLRKMSLVKKETNIFVKFTVETNKKMYLIKLNKNKLNFLNK